jgi:DtxR family Mn-dependent transcriptional regulator
MRSLTEENYLKALFNLADAQEHVSVKQLAQGLEIKMPTVTSMMKKLAEKGLVHYESYKPLKLTHHGKKEAGLVIRKHRLTEMYLVEKMGFGWEEVHEIAEQVEHINSPKFFERMDELLGYPSVDPHGSPIPDTTGQITEQDYKPLSCGNPGNRVRLAALAHSSTDFLEFLNSRDLRLGTTLEIISTEPYDSSMVVRYENHSMESLSVKVCERLLVEELDQ